ncbi:hypothetical protein GE061_000262 [Apolygus lucorum]|uniref:Structure-specific endonuclease subunit SLX1 homolog n=1 Tax=Apolygus lucorum TaxID=248454 RepID=A0A6A4KNX6_APOLU|nr:hypothetical protein GE061_000262 [Apolygus lucorum]
MLIKTVQRVARDAVAGFTVNPSRRISQHNKGSKYGGAKRTNNKGPWEMAMIVCGFPNEISALRFEWAWQNPLQSRRLSALPKRKPRESLLAYHLRLLDKMLSSPPWIRLPLSIHCLNVDIIGNLEELLLCKPNHMKVLQGPPSMASEISQSEDLLDCGLCDDELLGVKLVKCYNNECTFTGHVTCLATRILSGSDQILPISGPCPSCRVTLLWGRLMKPFQSSNTLSVPVK